jgi:hypothetical protein|nr:hypothetical protein Q903MT_gene3219 [Picea sitchensis]
MSWDDQTGWMAAANQEQIGWPPLPRVWEQVFLNLLQGCVGWASTNLVMLDGGMRYESAQQIGDFYYSGWGNKHLSELSFDVNRSGGSRGQVGHSPVIFDAIYLNKVFDELAILSFPDG